MNTRTVGVPLNSATSQYDRLIRSIEPDSIKIDDRSFTELLAFSAAYGALINFVDLNGEIDGDWTMFFLSDPTIILATIAAMDLAELELLLWSLLKNARGTNSEGTKSDNLNSCCSLIIRLAKQADSWLEGAHRNRSSRSARLFATEVIAEIKNSLGSHLQRVLSVAASIADSSPSGESLEKIISQFSSIWGIDQSVLSTSALDGNQLESVLAEIEAIIKDVLIVFREIQKFALKYLPATLLDTDHAPQSALYIAFAELFKFEQETINTIPTRLSNFYYVDVLRESKKGPVPDSVYITLSLDPAAGVDAASVPAGTLFPAGSEPDGSDILYVSDVAVSVSAATIASMRATRQVMGPLYEVLALSPHVSPDIASPDVESPYIESPDVTSPDFDSPYVTSPTIESPDIESPDFDSPYITSPYIESPDIESPDVQSPWVTSPDIESPDFDSPYIPSPCIESPDIESPDIQSPWITSPDYDSPFISSPFISSPFIDSPYVESPEIESPTINSPHRESPWIWPLGEDQNVSVPLSAKPDPAEISRSMTVLASKFNTLARQSATGPEGPMHSSGFKSGPFIGNNLSPPVESVLQEVMGSVVNIDLMNNEAIGKGLPTGLLPWATFGESSVGTGDMTVTTPVTLGFIIASNYLMLTGGSRHVSITFQLPAQAWTDLHSKLADIGAAVNLPIDEVFEQVINRAFNIWASTTAGWFQIEPYVTEASLESSPPCFSFDFTLVTDAPPFVAFNPATTTPPPTNPGGPDDLNPAPDLPTLKAYLNQDPIVIVGQYVDVEVFPLSLLANLEFEQFEIRTSTKDLTDFSVSSSSGTIDPSKPFPVFGGTPVVGSYLQFSNLELFVKQPQSGSLAVSLTWYGLPQNPTGFAGYYEGYTMGTGVSPSPAPLFDNQSFQCSITVSNPGLWDVASAGYLTSPVVSTSPSFGSDLYLFRTQPDYEHPVPVPNGRLYPTTDFDYLMITDGYPSKYYSPASSALCITLIEPPYAFGNLLYAPNVLNAAIEELPKPNVVSDSTVACIPLAEAIDKIDAINKLGTTTPNTKSDVIGQVHQAQGELLMAAQAYLTNALAGFSGDWATWVKETFTVPGNKPVPYQARVIGNTLLGTVQTMEAEGGMLSSPSSDAGIVGAMLRANEIVQGVIQLQAALDECAAVPDDKYLAAIKSNLSPILPTLRANYKACTETNTTVVYPNPPWLPQAQGISVNYSAVCDYRPSKGGQSCANFYYLLPFGGYAAAPEGSDELPLFQTPETSSLELGYSGLIAAQQLSMLVQMSASSLLASSDLTWQYQSSGEWTTFLSTQIPVDTTNGLQNSGVLILNLPQNTLDQDGTAPDDYRWIRATTTKPETFPESIGFYPHVLTATWDSNDGGSGQHLSQPLPPYSIKSSAQTLSAIKTITNPMESFGGRPAQTDQTFQMDLAERLRHKDRAVLPWDYEQLVLEEFASVWKVQALSATSSQRFNRPGCVTIVVVPGPQSQQALDPTAPISTSDFLEQIANYLVARSSVFAAIQVVNPIYVRITVYSEVMFLDPSDGSSCVNQLNADLILYLSPWFYDVERASLKGAYVDEDAIRQFIQMRTYVKAVTSIRLTYDTPLDSLDCYFLTSAKSHHITESF
jgi:hypothetical protein